MEELFEDMLRDVYYAEKKITKELPKMAKKATSEELKAAFEKHLEETEGQVERLEQIFEMIGKAARGKKCEAIEGLAAEAKEMMETVENDSVLDAALVSDAQAVEHYEMARYGALISFANQLGMKDAVKLLQATLEEEKATDAALTELAESSINETALQQAA